MALDPGIEKLLVLQERDVHRDELERNLEDVAARTKATLKDIEAVNARMDKARAEHNALELARRDLEKRTAETEGQRDRFKTQQLAVRKNDEYAALEKQIEDCAVRLDQLETETIEFMLKIDASAVALAGVRKNCEEETARIKAVISSLERVREKVSADLVDAAAQAAKVREAIDPALLSTYTYVKSRVKRPPYIVPIADQHCMGCHLKVSNDIVQQSRAAGQITRCNSCGRIVYREA
jgi:hypothetical protein